MSFWVDICKSSSNWKSDDKILFIAVSSFIILLLPKNSDRLNAKYLLSLSIYSIGIVAPCCISFKIEIWLLSLSFWASLFASINFLSNLLIASSIV